MFRSGSSDIHFLQIDRLCLYTARSSFFSNIPPYVFPIVKPKSKTTTNVNLSVARSDLHTLFLFDDAERVIVIVSMQVSQKT